MGASAPSSEADESSPRVVAIRVPCAGMVPPPFVDYALRSGARGVVVAACPGEDCEFRFGVRWTEERFAGEREPRLRATVDRSRVRLVHAAREDRAALGAEVSSLARTIAEKRTVNRNTTQKEPTT